MKHTTNKKNIRDNAPSAVSIEKTPFYFLDLSVRDDRTKILQITEEKSLSLDPEICTRARADLTHPRNRLGLEMAWLPGISPKRARELVAAVRDNPESLISGWEAEPLSKANLFSSVIELLSPDLPSSEWSRWICALAETVESIDPEKVLRLVNEDRAVAGFSEIKAVDQVEKEIENRAQSYKECVKYAVNRMSAGQLVEVMTSIVTIATNNGNKHAPSLIDEIVDGYQIEAQPHLISGAEKIEKVIEHAKLAAKTDEATLMSTINTLEKSVREWDIIAQPIQLSLKSRGLEHKISSELGYKIRSLAVDIANEHGLLDATKKITSLLQEVFAELPDFAAKLEEDNEALENLFQQRDKSEADEVEWKKSIKYEADIGAIFKEKLKISSDGIEWKGKNYPLKSITRVRWGGTRHSVNGIPTGTTYTIAFGDARSMASVELRRQEVYSQFLDKLWKGVCVRLMGETLLALKNGEKIKCGDAVIDDRGVELTRHKFFSSERAYFPLNAVHTWHADGNFMIGAQADKKCHSRLSYLHHDNAHIIEACISAAFKKWRGKISGLLD